MKSLIGHGSQQPRLNAIDQIAVNLAVNLASQPSIYGGD
tara:strand:- start:534 stop:650 length:117 start_codon:yes stop_codon:yes gene_type:complete